MQSDASLSVAEVARRSVRLREADDPEGAISLLESALARHPDEAVLWQCLGLAHRALLDSEPALAALTRAAALAPQDGRIVHALAHVSMEAGLPAVELFDRARAMLPGDGSVLIGRAAAQLAAGEADAAIADLDDACRASPLWLEGHRALADLRWQSGRGEAYAASYTAALGRDPQALALWLALIDGHLRLERYDWAAAALEQARSVLGMRGELEPVAAICASELGDSAAADALFARLLSQSAYLRDTDFVVRGVRHLLRTGRPAPAAALAQNALAAPDCYKVWPYVATAWRMLGDPQWQWLEGDPRLVRRVQVYAPDELPAIAATLRALHHCPHEPAGQSVRTGSQTDGPLFARLEPGIRDLRRRIEAAVRDHVATLGDPDPRHPILRHRPRRVRFAGSWSVRLQGAGHHSHHIHPQGWLSSALYIAVPPPAEAGDAPAGHLQFGVPPRELGLALEPFAAVVPEPGWLTLFPSTMWHGTVPIAGGERLTVAFDVRP